MAGRRSSPSIMCILMAALAASIPAAVLLAESREPGDDKGHHHLPMLISFEGRDGFEATWAIRRHDVAPAGFANGSRHWFAFPGNEHLAPDLIGGLHNLPGLLVGKEPTLHATEVLTRRPATGDDVPLKHALAALKVITTETLRLKPIWAAVSEGWEHGTRVAAEHLPYIEHWDTMCYEVILAKRSGRWLGPFNELLRKSAGIHSLEEALAVVDVLVDKSLQELVDTHAIPVAVVQCQQPADHRQGLIHMTIHGGGDEEATLAINRDEVTLAGFTNRSHHWFAFPRNEHLLPTPCTTLPFGNSYEDLIGGLHNLPGLPIGKEPSLQANKVLSIHNPVTAGDHVPLKRALATLKVITTDAIRLKPIREAVSKGWEGETRVAVEHLPYIEHWDTMSYEIILANRTGRWLGPFTELLKKSAGIHSLEEALAVVDMLVDCSLEDVVEAHARKA
ncbi:hypothetical protein U9M48_030423, partial [Paspalum notatum var. saurae]